MAWARLIYKSPAILGPFSRGNTRQHLKNFEFSLFLFRMLKNSIIYRMNIFLSQNIHFLRGLGCRQGPFDKEIRTLWTCDRMKIHSLLLRSETSAISVTFPLSSVIGNAIESSHSFGLGSWRHRARTVRSDYY